jgi:Tol biopolymer transport system component
MRVFHSASQLIRFALLIGLCTSIVTGCSPAGRPQSTLEQPRTPAPARQPTASDLLTQLPTATPSAARKPATWIAYVATLDRMAGEYDIWVMRPDGSDRHPLVSEPGLETVPTWSSDGAALAFVSTRDSRDPADCANGYVELRCNFDIYRLALATGELTRITTSPNVDRDPDWSPNGAQMVYRSKRVGKFSSELMIIDLASGQIRTLATGATGYYTPAWSPDGSQIAYGKDVDGGRTIQICVIRIDGANERCLTDGQQIDTNPAWSPDGRQIAYVSLSTDPNVSTGFIMLVAAAGGAPRYLDSSYVALPGYAPTWSPDGSQLAYVSLGALHRTLAIVAVEGTQGMLVENENWSFTSPAWSPPVVLPPW